MPLVLAAPSFLSLSWLCGAFVMLGGVVAPVAYMFVKSKTPTHVQHYA